MKQIKKIKKSAQTQDELDVSAKRINAPAELQQKANAFLNSSNVDTKELKEIVYQLKDPECNPIDVIHVLEVIFKNLLKRKCIFTNEPEQSKAMTQLKTKKKTPVNKCHTLYNEAWSFLLECLGGTSKEEAGVALKACMQLLTAEAKHSKNKNGAGKRLGSILTTLIKSGTTPPVALAAFEKYAHCLDILQMIYELLPDLMPADFVGSPNLALNYLAIVNLLDLGKSNLAANQYHFNPRKEEGFDLEYTCKQLNTVWNSIMASCSGLDEKLHRQVLVVLLERILPHLENPILLTDFLMDSLHQFDGPIALLALQGIFILMQKQNITYPDVYQKLYNMFYPRMFYNKYKARLFYLADIFLTSTHLPENLVAAFVKRLARLSLKCSTEDAIIIIRFVCNLLLRHTGLQRLICATGAASAVEIADPYDETAVDPVKAGALGSSLWEMSLLQKHAVPEVANAARFVTKSLPVMEFDLGPLLEMKESDLFDDEVKKQMKQFAMGYERPTSFALPQNDVVTKYWDLI